MEIRLAASIEVLAGLAGEVRADARWWSRAWGGAAHALRLGAERPHQPARARDRKRHDLERIRWCWLAFGSEGRFEQTFSRTRTTGFCSRRTTAARRPRRARPLPFAREVNEALDACGYPLCKGNVMASNPGFRSRSTNGRPRWRAGSTSRSRRRSSTPRSASTSVRCTATVAGRAARLGLSPCARIRLPAPPRRGGAQGTSARPLRRVRHRGGNDQLEAARREGVRGSARVYALAHGLQQTNTAERLRAASRTSACAMSPPRRTLFTSSRACGCAQKAGSENRVAPDSLNRLERATLKEALRLGRELQERLALDYQL